MHRIIIIIVIIIWQDRESFSYKTKQELTKSTFLQAVLKKVELSLKSVSGSQP